MLDFIKKYYTQYQEVVKYLFFGVLTTLVNFITYYLLVFIFKTEEGALGITA